MSKYIDADRLKEFLINKHKEFTEKSKNNCFMQYQFMADGLNIAEQMVDSLQQEQDLIIINKKDWEAQEQFRKNKDFGKPIQKEQQKVDLDADIEMEWDSFNKHLAEYGEESEDVVWLNWYSFNEFARHFYELGLKAK